MSVLKLKCVDQVLTLINTPVIASGGIEENTLEVDFCSRWNGFVKTAVFYKKEDEVYNVLMVNDSCLIPDEITMTDGVFYFGIYGVNGVKRNTSEIKSYKIVKGSFIEGQEPGEPTPDVYTQIMDLHNQIMEKYTSIFEDINNIVADSVLRGVINQNNNDEFIKIWVGTKEEYDNEIIDDNTIYHVTDYDIPVPNAENVTMSLKGMDLYDIFESDDADQLSPIVQKATNDSDGNKISTTYRKTSESSQYIDEFLTETGLQGITQCYGENSQNIPLTLLEGKTYTDIIGVGFRLEIDSDYAWFSTLFNNGVARGICYGCSETHIYMIEFRINQDNEFVCIGLQRQVLKGTSLLDAVQIEYTYEEVETAYIRSINIYY